MCEEPYYHYENYCQCRMRRRIKGCYQEIVSYIPKHLAIVGQILGLKNKNDEWTSGWVVESVGHLKKRKEYQSGDVRVSAFY